MAIVLVHGSCTTYQRHESPDHRVQEFVSCGLCFDQFELNVFINYHLISKPFLSIFRVEG